MKRDISEPFIPNWGAFWDIALRVAARKLAEEAGVKVVRVMDGDKVVGYLDLRGETKE